MKKPQTIYAILVQNKTTKHYSFIDLNYSIHAPHIRASRNKKVVEIALEGIKNLPNTENYTFKLVTVQEVK